MKRTKIVATVSDFKCNEEYISSLWKAGANVIRLNTAHIDTAIAADMVKVIRAVSDELAILIDTKGPEVRTMNVDPTMEVDFGDQVKVTGDLTQTDCLHVNYPGFVGDVKNGSKLLIDDGEIELEVKSKDENFLHCEVTNKGAIKNRKSVNVPGASIELPSLTAKDRDFILFSIENNIDFIAHSFVRNAQDVLDIQSILDEHESPIKIIAKIENQEGVDKIDEILDHAYGVMVARGDLGIEIPAESIPSVARTLIRKSIKKRRPVIMATQMLHTMIENPRPTRAEISDIANAVYNRCDAIMLSGETANGPYGVEAVEIMNKVACEVEVSKDKRNDIVPETGGKTGCFLSKTAIEASEEMVLEAIITDTLSGRNARSLSSYRGTLPVYAMCYLPRVKRELALSYGVYPQLFKPKSNRDKTIRSILKNLVDQGKIKTDDTIAYLGTSYGVKGMASFLEIMEVEEGISKRNKDELEYTIGSKDM